MHTCTGFGDSAACRKAPLKSPGKPTEKMFARLALSTSSVNTASVTTGRTASVAQSLPHSGTEAGREDILPRDAAFHGATLAP